MKIKHTPGPWSVRSIGPGTHMIGSEACNDVVANVYVRTKEGRANARLIRAAPKLLEALLEIRKIQPMPNHTWDLCNSAIEQAGGPRDDDP